MSILNKIKALQRQRSLLVEDLLKVRLMIRGTFGETYRRCGKSTCWCAKGKGHLYTRITWTENMQSKTKAIPKKDIDWIKKTTENYRRFRKLRQKIRNLDNQFKVLFDQFENEMIEKTKKLRNY